MEPRSMAQRARAGLRDDALNIAEELVVDRGFRAFSMRDLATRVGVSRQTLYNEFGDRRGVASALVLRSTERFLDEIEQALAGEADLHAAWVAAVRGALARAEDNPLLKTLLTGDEGTPELFGTDSEPIVVAARERAAGYLRRRWPELDPDAVGLAAETAARLTVSHIVLPLAPADVVAEQVATVVTRICEWR
ncbi:TetR family transcriptional regulator [Pseudonocardia halophobica]|uniref:TetR/AcrR family transcriptional regulator n=1 Tax=Pseudonocardia halophobica TaxID=29401 RepID=UPI003D8C0214